MNNNISNKTNLLCLPTTRYYGSKRRLTPWLHEIFSQISFKSAFDRFGGTASVSLLLQNMGKTVTYHDALNFNTIIAHSLLSLKINKISDKDMELFINGIKPTKGIISKEFNNIYYSRKENQWLDGIASKLQQLKDDDFKMACWYCLFQACLKKRPFNMFHRANYYLRKADVKRTFGNLVTWNTSFPEHMKTAYQELVKYEHNRSKKLKKAKIISSENIGNRYINSDLIYLDPPYSGKQNSDDYFKRYHFLEGLTHYNDWENMINPNSSIKQIETPDYLKDWHNKKKIRELLYAEIEKYRHRIVVLSYQADGYPNIDSIYSYFVSLFKKVKIDRKPFGHALCKNKKTEVVITGLPK